MNNIYKKLSAILMFLSMLGCFCLEVSFAYAGANVGTLTPGSAPSGGGGGAAYSRQPLAFGYRISLVNSSGKHFSYTTSNGETVTTKSVDYWNKSQSYPRTGCEGGCMDAISGYQALTSSGFNISKNAERCFYTQKYTKQEIVDNNSASFNCLTVKDDRAKKYFSADTTKKNSDIKIVGTGNMVFDEIAGLSNCKTQSYVQFDPISGSGPCASHTGNNFAGNAALAIASRFFQGKNKTIDFRTLNQYLKNSGYNRENTDESNVKKAVSDKIYFQLEPVAAIQIQNTGNIYVGTITEIFKMWSQSNPKYYHTWYSGFSLYPDLSPIVYAKKNSGDQGSKAGITLSPDGSGLLKIVGDDDTSPENIYREKSAFGVALYYLPDYIDSGCTNEAAQTIYSKYYNNGSLMAGKSSTSYDKEIAELCISGSDDNCEHLKSDSLKSYGITKVNQVTCNKPQCNTTANRIYNKSAIEIFKLLINFYKDKFAGFDEDTRIKKESGNQYITNFESKKVFGVTSDDDLCNPISCNSILSKISKTEDNLDQLKGRFGDYDLLNPEILKALYQQTENDTSWISKASCKGTPTCPVTPVKASCNGSNRFVLSDTVDDTNSTKSDDEKCLKNGIAYNSLKDNNNNNNNKIINQKNNTQTSFDSEYGSTNNPGYCWESVEFNFPTGVTNITASNTFRWSINGNSDNINDNLFGTMIVTRKCYLSSDITKSNKFTITSKWAEVREKRTQKIDGTLNYQNNDWRINPKITIDYEEALPNNVSNKHTILETSDDLDVNLKKFEMYTYDNNGKELGDYNIVFYGNNGNVENPDDFNYKDNDPRQFTCGTGIACSSLKYVKMTATYDLTYGNAFKWYSNRSDKDTTTSLSDIDSEQYTEEDGMLGPYRFIGYGLPTSFITPTNLAGKYDYGYDLSTSKGNGKLYAEVSQIGTKNKNGDTYHFDKMVKFAITDDDDNTNDKIVYSCGFDINNHIFGNEDEPCEEGKCEMPKGLDVVFRTIDLMDSNSKEELDRAFPGMSGTGRDMGANWSEIYDIDDPNKGAENIFSILDSSIYSKEPMYRITLDVALIKEIRSLNNKVKGDPYSDKTEVTDGKAKAGEDGYDFSDLNEYGGGIRSLFLSYLYNKGKLKTSCITNSGNGRNPDCFKSLVID